MIRLLVALLLMAAPAQAAAPRCDIALTLALDYSNSVDLSEIEEQAKGHAAAILSDEFVHAFTGGDAYLQVVIFAAGVRAVPVPWARVTSRADLENISGAILTAQRPATGIGTDLHLALQGIVDTFADGPPGCMRQVIDMATDGDPETGVAKAGALKAVLDTLDPGAVQVNVLLVGTDDKMTDFARENLVFGFGAFFQRINDWHEIEGALRAKLLREVS